MTVKEAKTPKNIKPKELTPYQGSKRTFGKFRCHNAKCNREWASAHTWANMGQNCRECGNKVYPYTQFKLERRHPPEAVKGLNKNHHVSLCEKCEILGYSCLILGNNDHSHTKRSEIKKPADKNKKDDDAKISGKKKRSRRSKKKKAEKKTSEDSHVAKK